MFTKINYLCIIIIGLTIISNCFAALDSNLPYKEGELLIKFGLQKELISLVIIRCYVIL